MLLTGEPIFTALFGWMILGETLSFIGLAGSAIIVACVIGETYLDARNAAASQTSPTPAIPNVTGDVPSVTFG